jgi:hypothetical protein
MGAILVLVSPARYPPHRGLGTNCSEVSQPGIPAIVNYLASLPWHPTPNCESGHFYMINNLSPGFLPNGKNMPAVGDLFDMFDFR